MSDYRRENWQGPGHPRWKDGGGREKYYGSNWDEIRAKALNRDDHCCVVCKKGEEELGMSPDVHHIMPLRRFDEPEDANFLENLVTLCKKHHGYVEGWCMAPADRAF
jgi:5-methylcytosine-specific restriction endonuclease McrA